MTVPRGVERNEGNARFRPGAKTGGKANLSPFKLSHEGRSPILTEVEGRVASLEAHL